MGILHRANQHKVISVYGEKSLKTHTFKYPNGHTTEKSSLTSSIRAATICIERVREYSMGTSNMPICSALIKVVLN